MLDENNTEEWRVVPGWEAYELSSLGRLRRKKGVRCREARLIKQRTDTGGYATYCLSMNNKVWVKRVSRLLLLTFRPHSQSSSLCVRHLNGDQRDNRLENLAWGTIQDNADDRAAHGTQPRGERSPNAALTDSDVSDIRNAARAGVSQNALARKYNVARSTIQRAISGECWNHIPLHRAVCPE